MRVEAWLFSAGVAFFVPIGLIYGYVADWEAVGTVGFLLLGGMFALAGGYMWITARRIDIRPEDTPTADIEDRAGEVGVFSPHSWWPLVLGVAVTLAFAGIAIGWWMTGLGFAVGIVGLVGQLFEFSRGQHVH
ncbi:cytochrome c oxidase subunit 4 [Georgenia subflava]|uniref:Cytochrome c oxidase polypeptide 4 n=1 Tax=Georgenia subflava TaxID=1622177 RepID=A0A6N7EN78_9MICO|nr:cytochrome c oxidase subunit 4 [Georgenia subflava]